MTEPTDAELDAVLCKHWPAFSMQATLVRMWVRAAMRDAIAKWGTPPAEQAAPKAAPVVWLSSKQLRGVTALHGQYLPFRCQPEGRFDTPVYLVEAAPKAAPGEPRWWRKRADEIEAQVALTGSPEAMRCYTDMRTLLQAVAVAAPQQEAQEPVAVPKFNCWSTNEGDSWFDHPADSQAIYDCLGDDAKVGDEYELTAGWISVTARYRITEVVGDGEEYEVECISHPQANTAPQPAPAPLSDAIEHYLESQDALDSREYAGINAESYEKLIRCRNTSRKDLDAALAAQGGK